MNKLGFTNGDGFIIMGCCWFLYCFLTYLLTSPENQFQQIVHENLFNQALMGVIIVGIGAILKRIKWYSNTWIIIIRGKGNEHKINI